jgi:uncharacterized repeat protein (TIGR03803 family)
MRIAAAVVAGVMIAGCSSSGAGPLAPAASNALRGISSPKSSSGYFSLYSFSGKASGGEPQANLLAVKGNLYGTTSSYGAGYGTVFEISPFGKLRILHKFESNPDGAYPQAGLIDVNGTLYGTTSAGGVHNAGTAFAITTGGIEHVIHNFGGKGDGAEPQAQLVAVDGILYGTTLNGGTHDKGVVFEMTPAGDEHVLHSFAGAPGDGGHPSAPLIYVKGWLYGTTRAGGKVKNGGSAFRISAVGEEKVIHAFGVENGDGENPAAGLVYVAGVLYGTTLHGGENGRGTVFEMDTDGFSLVLHSFGAGTDGAYPQSNLVETNDAFYGTTTGGGGSPRKANQCISSGITRNTGYFRCGTIFKVDRGGSEEVIYRFAGSPDGANPEAGLTGSDGVFYGTTFWGGASGYYGTVFRLLP